MVKVIQGYITDQPVDAIVNPANSYLGNEGGAARIIQEAAGRELIDEWREHIKENEELKTGEAMWTKSGELVCKYVFHTVGPRCRKGQVIFIGESK